MSPYESLLVRDESERVRMSHHASGAYMSQSESTTGNQPIVTLRSYNHISSARRTTECERSNYRSGATSAFGKRTMRWALKIVAQIYDGRLTTIWGGVALNTKTNECIYVYRTRGPNTTSSTMTTEVSYNSFLSVDTVRDTLTADSRGVEDVPRRG